MKRAGVTNPFRVVETNVKGFTNFYSGYHQKVLPTEFVVAGIRALPDVEDFSIMRFAQPVRQIWMMRALLERPPRRLRPAR